jgi:hypothetical protein
LNCGKGEPCGCDDPMPDARDGFAYEWHRLYGEGPLSWHSNPWVSVTKFGLVNQ